MKRLMHYMKHFTVLFRKNKLLYISSTFISLVIVLLLVFKSYNKSKPVNNFVETSKKAIITSEIAKKEEVTSTVLSEENTTYLSEDTISEVELSQAPTDFSRSSSDYSSHTSNTSKRKTTNDDSFQSNDCELGEIQNDNEVMKTRDDYVSDETKESNELSNNDVINETEVETENVQEKINQYLLNLQKELVYDRYREYQNTKEGGRWKNWFERIDAYCDEYCNGTISKQELLNLIPTVKLIGCEEYNDANKYYRIIEHSKSLHTGYVWWEGEYRSYVEHGTGYLFVTKTDITGRTYKDVCDNVVVQEWIDNYWQVLNPDEDIDFWDIFALCVNFYYYRHPEYFYTRINNENGRWMLYHVFGWYERFDCD